MTFSFDVALPAALDRVRLRIGDIDEAVPLRQDETIAALIEAVGETGAVAVLAESLANEFAQRPDSIGGNGRTIAWSQRVTAWQKTAAAARAELASAMAPVEGAGTLGSLRPVRAGSRVHGEYIREPGEFTWGGGR